MEASEPKWVNPDAILYGVNSLRLGGLRLVIDQAALVFDYDVLVSKMSSYIY